MDILNKILDFLADLGKKTSVKTKEMKKIMKLKSEVSACEEAALKKYEEIGRLYYAAYGEEESCEFAKQCVAIRNAENAVKKLKSELKEAQEEFKSK